MEKGYTLNEAMKFTSIDLNEEKKQAVFFCLRELSKGVPVRTAFEKLRFHNEVISYLYFAERHGDLEIALREGGNAEPEACAARKNEKSSAISSFPLFHDWYSSVYLSVSYCSAVSANLLFNEY
ncbi:hypothetical protein MGI18_20290 [Bacillus sp. OVS6]|nr:hypothetical protein MGI18_20290 [Bacillus sp. OVS6]